MVEFIYPATHTNNVIYLEVRWDNNLEIGRLGVFPFEKGFYIYVGSKKRNILARINRHKKVEKTLKYYKNYNI